MNPRTLLLLLPLFAAAIFLLGLRDGDENGNPSTGNGSSSAGRDSRMVLPNTRSERPPTKSGDRRKSSRLRSTPSGLRYEVLEEGSGEAPTLADGVSVHYEGRLPDGTVFDSSYEGGPRRFQVKQVIAGWQEGLQLMRTGSKYRFVIPPELAYGERGVGSTIPPNTALTFEIKLVSVNRLAPLKESTTGGRPTRPPE